MLRRLSSVTSVVFLVAIAFFQFTPFVSWYAGKLAGNWTDSDGDVLIVLSAEAQRDNIIGLTSYWRAVYAVRAWRAGHFRTVVVSGGHVPGVPESLAVVIGQFLESNGVPRAAILLENESTTTRENAVNTARLLAHTPGRKVLLTSDFHMFRAARTFRAAGLDVVPRPFPDVGKQANDWKNREYCVFELAGETVRIVGYWLRGWLG